MENGLNLKTVVTRNSFYVLAREIGYGEKSFHSGREVRRLRTYMDELWATSILSTEKSTGLRTGSRILSQYQTTKVGEFTVALNFLVANIILGIGKRYTRIDMAEIRALDSDASRLLHQRLCAWIDPGKTGKITMESLDGYVWFEPASNINSMRRRKTAIRKALAELEALGWTITEYVDSKFAITRREIPN
jgi:hypothetical protein